MCRMLVAEFQCRVLPQRMRRQLSGIVYYLHQQAVQFRVHEWRWAVRRVRLVVQQRVLQGRVVMRYMLVAELQCRVLPQRVRQHLSRIMCCMFQQAVQFGVHK